MEKIVLDTYAVVALLFDEAGAHKVQNTIDEAKDKRLPLLMNVVNLGEVFYTVQRKHGTNSALKACNALESLPVNLISPGKELSLLAASLKSEKKMPYADCFAAATAMMYKAALLTGDKEFKQVEKETEVIWI